MASFSFVLLTINGEFHSDSKLEKTKIWQSRFDEERRAIIGKNKHGSNFIQIKFKNGVSALIYTKGRFKLTINNFDYERVLPDLPRLINLLRIRYAQHLFENELLSCSFRVTQFRIGINAQLRDCTVILSIEKISRFFCQFEEAGVLRIPFEDLFFYFEKDDVNHLDGASNFHFQIYHNNSERGHLIVYNNFKVNLITKHTEHLSKLFTVSANFIRHMQNLCVK